MPLLHVLQLFSSTQGSCSLRTEHVETLLDTHLCLIGFGRFDNSHIFNHSHVSFQIASEHNSQSISCFQGLTVFKDVH